MMSIFFRKRSVLDKRRQKIKKELSRVDNDIRSLSKGWVRKSKRVVGRLSDVGESVINDSEDSSDGRMTHVKRSAGHDETEDEKTHSPREHIVNVRDERLAEYLSSSFHSSRPLRHEREIQRNKAVFLSIVVLIVFFWALWRFLFL